MKFSWVKYLLLAMFAFWATGTAKFAHEQLEHHGKDLSVADADDDDDDDDSSFALGTTQPVPSAAHPQHQTPAPHHPCPICQMLAGMVLDKSVPPVLPTPGTQLISTLILFDRVAPTLHACFVLSARGPPTIV